jgi:hypothetical protein
MAPSRHPADLAADSAILAGHRVGDYVRRATPAGARLLARVARGQAGSTPVILVTTSITPCRHTAGPTVLDERGEDRARDSTADRCGDVVGADQIPMPLEVTVRAGEPASRRLRHPTPAGRTGRGAAALVDQPDADAGALGLVAKCTEKMGTPPLPQTEIVHLPNIPAGDALWIADHQGSDPVAKGERNDLLGGLMVSLMDAAAVTSFGLSLPESKPAPPT